MSNHRLRSDQDPYTGMIDCAKRIVDEEGFRYVGLLPHYASNLLMSLQGIVPWMGDNFTRSVASVRILLPSIAADCADWLQLT
jgi:hypothetical protein